MAAIPWWVWLGVGFLIALSSSYVGGNIAWFAWIGWFFIIIGIIKLVAYFVLRKGVSKYEKAFEQPTHPPAAKKPAPAHQYYYCPRCRSVVHAQDVFCRKCGSRLR